MAQKLDLRDYDWCEVCGDEIKSSQLMKYYYATAAVLAKNYLTICETCEADFHTDTDEPAFTADEITEPQFERLVTWARKETFEAELASLKRQNCNGKEG